MSSIIERETQAEMNAAAVAKDRAITAAKAAAFDDLNRKAKDAKAMSQIRGLAKFAAERGAADERVKMAEEMYKYGGMSPNPSNPFLTPKGGNVNAAKVVEYINNRGTSPADLVFPPLTQGEVDTYMRANQSVHPDMYSRR